MSTSSTVIFSMGSGERKRCSNIAPVRRLRNLAWMKARRFPGVRCSTLNTECRSLLCLMIMPGRSWVAGMAIAVESPYKLLSVSGREAGSYRFRRVGNKTLFYTYLCRLENRTSLLQPPMEQTDCAILRRAADRNTIEIQLIGLNSHPLTFSEVPSCVLEDMNRRTRAQQEQPLHFFS